MEKWVEKNEIYAGPIFRLVQGTAVLDTGEHVPRDIVKHDGGVAVVPVLDDTVLLIRQFRIAVDGEMIELPAGRLEGNEDPKQRAQLELMEEIGYKAGRLIPVANFFSSPGFTNERIYLFLAFDLQPVERKPEFDERIEVETVPLVAIPDLLEKQTIQDGKTLIGLWALLAYLQQAQKGD